MSRPRLYWLFIVAFSLCGVLVWYARYRSCVVETQLEVRGLPATSVHLSSPYESTVLPVVVPADLSVVNDTIADSATWDSVIGMTLLDPALRGNRILKETDAPIDWIRQNATIAFNDKSHMIVVQMRCRATWSTDAAVLVETVADSLAEYLTSQDQRTQFNTRENAELTLSLIRSKMRRDERFYDRVERDPTLSEAFRDEALSYRREQIEELADAEARLLEVLEQIKVEESNPLKVRRTGPVKVKQTW